MKKASELLEAVLLEQFNDKLHFPCREQRDEPFYRQLPGQLSDQLRDRLWERLLLVFADQLRDQLYDHIRKDLQ